MAVVLSSEENTYFSSSNLRRSHSQPKFVTKQASFHSTPAPSHISDVFADAKVYPDSAPSSAPSSPRTIHAESTDLSCSSTPASNVSIASDCDDTLELAVHANDHFVIPHYGESGYFDQVEDLEAPTSPRTGDSYTVSPVDNDTEGNTSRPNTPEFILDVEHAEDDTAVRAQPSRHVDYLSHNWKEEDIWSSWKFIVSRRSEYSNAARLENASWRTWMKAKNHLKTVSPETLNWLKDCDVTWLYGPLQTGPNTLNPITTDPNSARLTKNNSFVNKKPILKKRSMSEVMLQRSLSASSLLKQAAAAVQAQEKDGRRRLARPTLERATTDYVTFPFSSRRLSRESSNLCPSSTSSGIISPCSEKKHIHFNEQVSQCIAVDIKGEDDDDDADTERYDNSDSDEGAIMMKRSRTKKKAPLLRRKSSKAAAAVEGKTIAMLPSTTLKYREDTPEPQETAMKHSTSYRSPIMSPSSSQETLRPSKGSGKFFFDDDDDEEEEAVSMGWQSPTKTDDKSTGLQRSSSTNSLNAEPAGMRRTSSGMFMPYEEGESSSNEGIIGRVIDTVNTARDIAHVIWNVGWRK
ncbi:protein phosphatase type 1 complex subunit Hex2/Reg1 [Colletotrichum scovillei]|uniref:Protein phosphatase type 1 complex subunit Hex2/Reg1 n=1 Tax=Colletotrichum scovillei TaxID=1209932 RepID=A0A9P7R5U0_9PEZI|nr:protein phosphatase type 1 complex subunit Hex2/Reg1 [Colletotrichum scovillei]KAF4781815.1 protein phosphatase type 1 complex subunit Hex2/Reg1 [Colletotrichum scovillei]KAG7050743.1 protein phosphatase type 1 complex subunit Hex2/Reg1 [Colletotrichum scovillei]KAG7069787.1 protein phosphatase type 1 complex subunit Hex2/Reg1 [Colletotrichum scovillei]KAG7073705.1 protein phosphatase type 1 complex subunit Hex2/Reg1 [Colletotrichum scovillei]